MIKSLIVEDEDLAAARLAEMIGRVANDVEIIGRTASVSETIEFLKSSNPDLMFLDINLSDGFSFEIFEAQRFETPPIIFTTAYSEYAIRAFELNSVSYLLKPITPENLSQALEKYRHFKWAEDEQDTQQVNYKKLIDDLLNPFKERFLIKINNKLETIKVEDIGYFFSEDKVSFIMLKSGRYVPIDYSLKTLSEQLDPSKFFRINRKYLVHINSIREMYYTSKSKIKVELQPENANESDLIFVAIEKVGLFKKWLSK
ncbi:MAG: LytTR family DNA-binding domain-containing protein [Bacteroidota bacterium]